MITIMLALAAASSTSYSTCTQDRTDELIAFAVAKYKKADSALNAQWKAISHPLQVMRAQKAWIAFRDAECLAQNSASPDGSLFPVFKYLCLAELTETRAKQLHELAIR